MFIAHSQISKGTGHCLVFNIIIITTIITTVITTSHIICCVFGLWQPIIGPLTDHHHHHHHHPHDHHHHP